MFALHPLFSDNVELLCYLCAYVFGGGNLLLKVDCFLCWFE